MTMCKVILLGLKPADISTSTSDTISETITTNSPSSDNDFLNVDIKPVVTPTTTTTAAASIVRND